MDSSSGIDYNAVLFYFFRFLFGPVLAGTCYQHLHCEFEPLSVNPQERVSNMSRLKLFGGIRCYLGNTDTKIAIPIRFKSIVINDIEAW